MDERGPRARGHRELLGALGASGALIAVAACALLIFSAVVAERGWPGMAASLAPAPLLLPSVASPGPTASVPLVQVGAATAPRGGPSRSPSGAVGGGSALTAVRGAGRAVSGRPQTASTVGAAPPVTPGPGRGSGSGPAVDIAPSLPGVPTPTAGSPSPKAPSPGGQTPGGQPAGGSSAGTPPPGPAPSPLAAAVNQTGQGAAGAVSSVSAPGAGAVGSITQTVVSALPHVADPVIGVLDIVDSPAPVPAGQPAWDPDSVAHATGLRGPALAGHVTGHRGKDQPALVP